VPWWGRQDSSWVTRPSSSNFHTPQAVKSQLDSASGSSARGTVAHEDLAAVDLEVESIERLDGSPHERDELVIPIEHRPRRRLSGRERARATTRARPPRRRSGGARPFRSALTGLRVAFCLLPCVPLPVQRLERANFVDEV
jgi:hypothetical protein